MAIASATLSLPTTGARPADSSCPFAERFGRPLPRGFAGEATGLSWREMCTTYATSKDHLHLVEFDRTPIGRGLSRYDAVLSLPSAAEPTGFTTRRLSTRATGDFAAMSDLLGEAGAHVEMIKLHQYSANDTWASILRATNGRHTAWSMGFGKTSGEANVSALLAAATRCYHPR